jgi:hypothetical protein
METKANREGLSPLQRQRYEALRGLLTRMLHSVEKQAENDVLWFAPGRSTLTLVMEWTDLEQRRTPSLSVTLGRCSDGRVWLQTNQKGILLAKEAV